MSRSTVRPVRRVLSLWLYNWPIQRRVVAQNELKGQPVILVRTDPRRGPCVAAVSPRAAGHGVAVGMPVSEAKSLLSHGDVCAGPDAFHVLPHEPDQDLAALRRLALSLEAFSPVVGLETTEPAEGLMMEVAGLGPLFDNRSPVPRSGDRAIPAATAASPLALDDTGVPRGERALARALLQRVRELGFHARVAIADTPGMAWAAVRYLSSSSPDAVALVPVGDREMIGRLPVAALRLPDECLDILAQLGISRIDGLQSLPRADVAVRLGEVVPRRLDQLSGAIYEPLIAVRRPDEFRAEQCLEYPISDHDSLQEVLRQLVERVCRDLTAAGRGALEWTIHLFRAEHRQPLKFCVRLFQPTDRADQVLALLQMQMEKAWLSGGRRSQGGPEADGDGWDEKRSRARRHRRLRTVRSSDGGQLEVVEVGVSVTACVVMSECQRELFDGNPRQDRRELAQLVDRLACRLGSDHVTTPVLGRAVQPERACRFVPLLDRPRRRRVSSRLSGTSPSALARPLQLFAPPLPLQPDVASTDSSSPRPSDSATSGDADGRVGGDPLADWNRVDSPPARFRRMGRQRGGGSARRSSRGAMVPPVLQIVRSWGPERIETGWWRGPTVRRDYWRIETETHQQFWVFRDLRTGRWYLHGTF